MKRADGDARQRRAKANALDESAVNWRVLLPLPRERAFSHLALFGGPDGLDRLIVRLGIAERVSLTMPRAHSADAAVVLGDAAASLRQAAASLSPGGSLYWEIVRRGLPRGPTARRVRRALLEAGLSQTGLYWIQPGSGSPKVFVPLDVRGAVAWYLDTFSWQWMGVVAAWFPRLSRALAAATAGRIGVTAVAQEGVLPPPSLLGHPDLPERLRSLPLRPVVYFRPHSRRVVMFPFAAGATVPEAVLKFSPVPERGSRTAGEQQTLSEARARLDFPMRSSIPEPLGLLEWSGLTVGIESYLPGRSILRAASLRGMPLSRKLADLDRVTGWLCRFHLANSFGRPLWGSEGWSLEEWVEDPLRFLEREFVLRPDEERLFAATRRAARALVGSPLPLVLSNWSLSAGNMCRSNREIKVYDWETVTRGLPLADLHYFLFGWGRLVSKELASSWRRTFIDLLIEPPRDRITRAVDRSLARYLAELEIDPRFRRLLCVLTWIQRAERRARKDGLNRRPFDPRLSALAEVGSEWLEG